MSGTLRNDETIISSISVTDIVFDVYLGKWNYRAIPKVKTWSYFLTIPKLDWNTSYNIKEAFHIDGSIQMNSWSFSIITYDKSKLEHKKEVRKIYKKLKQIPYE